MVYDYFLTKVFNHFNIHVGVGKIDTAKKSFTLRTLVECECLEGKGNPMIKVSPLIKEHNHLKHEFGCDDFSSEQQRC